MGKKRKLFLTADCQLIKKWRVKKSSMAVKAICASLMSNRLFT